MSKLQRDQPFLVVLLFDRAGYYGAVTATTESDVKRKASERSARAPSLVACTTPFLGCWSGNIPDVTAPPEHREATQGLLREPAED